MMIFILSIILGAGTLIGYQRFTAHTATTKDSSLQNPEPEPSISFALDQAPNQALVGTIVAMEGTTLWESRIAIVPAVLNEKVSLQQGEKIATGEDGNMVVAFAETVNISLEENTLLTMTQTLPANIVITQETGAATYILSSSEIPVSTRVKRLLVRIKRGETRILLDEGASFIKVSVKDGSAEVAYNDASFTSQRIRIGEGETFTFNNEKRTGTLQ